MSRALMYVGVWWRSFGNEEGLENGMEVWMNVRSCDVVQSVPTAVGQLGYRMLDLDDQDLVTQSN